MTKENLDALGQLLGCYFHQDWPEEFSSDTAALQAIVKNEPKSQLMAAATEIGVLLEAGLSETELKGIIADPIGCYFDPNSEGITCEQWLRQVRDKFAQALA